MKLSVYVGLYIDLSGLNKIVPVGDKYSVLELEREKWRKYRPYVRFIYNHRNVT